MTLPVAERPHAPGYGLPESTDELLDWAWAAALLAQAPTWWIASVRPDGRPHAMPVWGAWVDDRGYILGQRTSRWSRDLEGQPACVVHVQRGEDIAIVEGTARLITDADAAFLGRIGAGFAKYATTHGHHVDVSTWLGQAFWEIEPHTAFGFSDYMVDATRWRFRSVPAGSRRGDG